MIRVSPSILAADFANLEREIDTIKQAGALFCCSSALFLSPMRPMASAQSQVLSVVMSMKRSACLPPEAKTA